VLKGRSIVKGHLLERKTRRAAAVAVFVVVGLFSSVALGSFVAAPTASLGNNGPIDEGGSATVSFSGQFDPRLIRARASITPTPVTTAPWLRRPDVDSATLSLTAVSNPSGGTVEISSSDVIFHPAANLCGSNVASFDYTVSDGSLADTGTVTLDLSCITDPPHAVDSNLSTDEDTAKSIDLSSLVSDLETSDATSRTQSWSGRRTAG
jgi:hypothetical protein